jgi:glutathione synthase
MASLLTMAFVMDPIEGIDIEKDTTFLLMWEAQERGHHVFYVDPAELGVVDRRAAARAWPVTLRREVGRHVERGSARHLILDDDVDVAWQRTDPPVDSDYVTATQILGLCRRTVVLNRPAAILAHNEKLFALEFPDLMAETTVTRRIPELIDFMAKLGGEMIVKPLDGKGGEGIFHVANGDRNLFSILETATQFGTRWTMAQRYLPAVRQGDKRILLLDGEPLGALLRVPAAGETRSNLHVGGKPAQVPLDEADRKIVEALAPTLRDEGLFFVGIDVIGGKLTEINVTSPTGMQEINTLDGRNLEAQVIDAAERLASHRSTE